MKSVIIPVVAVMTFLFALLAISRHQTSDPFGRYQKFVTDHPQFKVSFTVTSFDKDPVQGTLLVERPKNRLLLRCQNDQNALFTASSTEEGYLEIDKGTETYDENPPAGGLVVFPSRISEAFRSAPNALFAKDLKRVIPPKSTVTEEGTTSTIHGVAQGQMGTVDVWASVNGDGEISMFRVKDNDPGHSTDIKWNLKYEYPSSVQLSDFTTPIPLGYMPYALNHTPLPIQKGKPFPTTGWVKPGSKDAIDLLQISNRKPFLIAILDKESPSERSKASLGALAKQLPVITVGVDADDPDGKLLAQINAPGTPSFFLVDGSGNVLKIWYGYDTENKAAFEKDVVDSMSGAGKTKKP